MLKISHLSVSVGEKKILKNVSLVVKSGQVDVLMGPNGSGKSTLAMALMGNPNYQIGKLSNCELDGKDITNLKPHERARAGLFVSFQNPLAIPGVRVTNILRFMEGKPDFSSFYKRLEKTAADLHLEAEFLRRPLNEDFSGGEKKRMELLQAIVLQPKYLVFDEIDTGLDIDALRLAAEKIRAWVKTGIDGQRPGVLLITHYQRILKYLPPDRVWVLKGGKIVSHGGLDLAKKIEEKGYSQV